MLPTNDDAAIVMQPSKQAFDLPASAIASQGSAVLRERPRAVRIVRGDHLHTVVIPQALVETIAVIGAVADQSLREIGKESLCEGVFDELGFMRRSTGHVQGERKTVAVANRHDFAALTASSRAHGGAPFFAELKLASMKASLRSSLPRSRKSSASFWSNRVSSPERCHCWNRR